MKQPKPDITVENHGSIFLLRPENIGAEEWLEEHTDGYWVGGALAVEPRYARDLVDGAIGAGWEVKGESISISLRRPRWQGGRMA